MPDNSFDVVSKIDLAEVSNAVQQALKEIIQRYDLKDSKSNIELNEKDKKLVLASQDEYKLKAVTEIRGQKLVKRQVPLKGLTYGEVIQAAGSTVKQEVSLQQGIPIEKSREIVGKIEALLEEPETALGREVCLVCHPHPLYGGTMHNKVVYRLARGLRRAGSIVMRFNFRGVGRSQGAHDQGDGELEDSRMLMDWLRSRYPGLPHAVAGFSFGSRVALRLGCALPATRRVIAVGL